MSDEFDPYLQWLGIRPEERPVDHYRLLGVQRFESNSATIGAAADERMALVRKFQTGPRGAHTQRLLNELATARVCLLNPLTKATYDDFLRGLASVSASGSPAPPLTGSESSVLPPSVGEQLRAAGGFPAGTIPTPVPPSMVSGPMPAPAMSAPVVPYGAAAGVMMPAAMPMATPVAYLPPGTFAGPMPLAIPVPSHDAMPMGGFATHPASHMPYMPASPPVAPQQVAPPPISPPVVSPPPAPARSAPSRSASPRSTRKVEPPPAAVPEAAPAENQEPTESIFTRRWFPVAVIGAVLMVAGAVWGLGRQWGRSEISEVTPEDSMVEPSEEGDSPDDDPKEPSKSRSDDLPKDVVIAQEGNGQINFPATVAKLHGPSLTLKVEGPEPVVTGWTSDADEVRWDFRVVKPDIFRVEVTYAAEDAWAGGQFVASVGDSEKSGEIVSTGGAGKFRTDKIFLTVKRQGQHSLSVRTKERVGAQLWVLQSVRFYPQGLSGK